MTRKKGVIRTPRLRLEPIAAADSAMLHAHWTDPEVREFLWDGKVISKEQVDEIVSTSERLFEEDGAGLWALRAPDGAFLGCAGFWFFHEPPERELVISLSPSAWGRGLASEACGALIEHALAKLGWTSIQASTDAPNQRSLNLIRRLGMDPVRQRPGAFGTTEVFQLDA